VTDIDALCYYAHSGLYAGDASQREDILDHCGRCSEVTGAFTKSGTQAGDDFLTRQVTFRYRAGVVKLSRNCGGDQAVHVDDEMFVEVTHPDGTKANFSHDFSSNCSGLVTDAGPFDVSSLFQPGANTVKVRFHDRCGQGDSATSRVVLIGG
jgi:hypothetical protein